VTFGQKAVEPNDGIAVVVGAGGGVGAALLEGLSMGGRYVQVIGFGRHTMPAIDFTDEASIAAAAASLASESGKLRLLVVASGYLHGAPLQGKAAQPERSLAQLDAEYLQHIFAINVIGPALLLKHFAPLLPSQGGCKVALLSAKVGSIGDNALGGWYGYRASKAALNQLVKTASIELTRRNRSSVCVALHPGTVSTALSEPFAKAGLNVRPAAQAALELLGVIESLVVAQTGGFYDYRGQELPW
jgi:NAD(P)-dependent dehydrogenase (short-subunit alcohol dehydrogenase family)